MRMQSRKGAKTVDGTTTTAVFTLQRTGAEGAELMFGNITGLTGTLQGSHDGTTYFEIESVLNAGGTITLNAAGGTITAVDYARLSWDAPGLHSVRFTRAAGSGPLRLLEYSGIFGAVTALLRKAVQYLASGISVTTTPPAVQCYSFIPDGTDELLIDATARKLWGVDVFTIDATPVYVKLYDKATAASEADTPIHRTGVPANATSTLGAGNNKGPWPVYIALTNGLSVRAVTGLADNSDSALTTAENYVNVYWST